MSGREPVAGPWSEYTESSLPPILQAALSCFVEQGYHGTVMRSIGSAAGLSVPGLYHHYQSKHAMLVELMQRAMADLYARSEQALAAAGPSVQARLDSHVTCLVLFHAHRSQLAFLAANEIRSLEPAAREAHIAARDRQQLILDQIIEEGVREGVFISESAHDASRAIVTMCTGVAQWYRLGGSLSPEQLADRYVDLVRRALGQTVDVVGA
jgi:AcrR family transcriptional regulator